nr:7TM diverse intracellular signaling [uncultured bacterium]
MNVVPGATTFLMHYPVSDKPLITEVILWDAKDFEIHATKELSWLNMNLGALFMIGVVNLFIYFSTREQTYLLYGTYVVFLFLSLLTMLGVATFFDPTRESQNWALNHGIFMFTGFTMGFALLFSRQFLNMSSYMPLFGRVLLLCGSFSIANAFLMGVHASTLEIAAHLLNATISTGLLLIGGIRASLRKYKPAYLYTAAWIILLIANIHICIGYAGLVEWDRSIVRNFVVGGVLESLILSFALGYRINLIQKTKEIETTKKDHYFHQMAKVFYPHQLHMIQDGKSLEDTMPTTPGEACVISSDIIASSKIQHVRAKEFFRNVFRRCYEEMMGGYDEKDLQSNAFRIKEMGDGFLCSVGYPFRAKSENPANDAVHLAFKFQQILVSESAILQQPEPVTCGIGISLDSISGFYPEFGTKEYDLYGRAIILATRYEGMRKFLFEKDATSRSTIILQEKVLREPRPLAAGGFFFN